MWEENIKTMIIFCNNQTTINDIKLIATKIEQTFILKSDIFIYEKISKYTSKFITFKIIATDGEEEREKIQELRAKFINRKARSNTFFTINALNRVILSEIGEIDPTYKIDWSNYQNRLLVLEADRTNKDRKYLANYQIQKLGCIYKEDNNWLLEEF
jgi:hypothetical protein